MHSRCKIILYIDVFLAEAISKASVDYFLSFTILV